MIDPEQDRIAQLDQAGADLRNWAIVYGQFLTALLEVGFERTEALDIILGWQAGQAVAMAAKLGVEIVDQRHPDDDDY